MTESKPDAKVQGTHLLTDKDFVDVVDAEGNDLAPVPKHWTVNDLPAGAEFKKSGSSSSGSGRAAKKTAAKKTAAKKAAAPSGSSDSGDSDAGADDTSGDSSAE